jgi:hypothetical protein
MRASIASAALVLFLCAGCSRWQTRADELQRTVDDLGGSSRKSKSDFILKFGPPTSCAPAPAGETCVWRGPFGSLGSAGAGGGVGKVSATERVRAIFDKSGLFISGLGGVRLGKRTYRGATEIQQEAQDAEAGDCHDGDVYQFGHCYPNTPGGGPPVNQNQVPPR